MIVTIDGPAGSGKSTVARQLAARLQVAYLDTGAMYRAVTLAALEADVPLDDHPGLTRLARACVIDLDCDPTSPRVRLDGLDVSDEIRTMRVSRATGIVARVAGVRSALVEQQRRIGQRLGSFVAEGRDQGTVVFPQADCKFLLEASLEQRAQRRHQEMTASGSRADYDDILANLEQRDAGDRVEWTPLLNSGEAVVMDATRLSAEDVVEAMNRVVTRGRTETTRSPGG